MLPVTTALIQPPALPSPLRTWTLDHLPPTMADTPRTVEGRLLARINEDRQFSEAVVVLKLADGRTRSFPLKALSDTDREYVARNSPKPAPLPGPAYPLVWTDYDPVKDKGKVNVSATAHFAFFWGNDRSGSGKAFFETGFLARTQALFEDVWNFNARQGVPMPLEDDPKRRKVAVYISGTGLPKHPDGFAFGGASVLMHPDALGPGSSVVGHEFTHVLQFYSGGFRDNPLVGWFWECHGNWNSHQFNPGYAPALEVYADRAHYELTSSRMNYGSWPFLQLLAEDPRYGPALCDALWTECRRDARGKALEDPIQTLQRIGAKRGLDVGDLIGTLAARMANWDFTHQYVYRRLLREHAAREAMPGRSRVVLRPLPDRTGWYAPLYSHAPRTYGVNLIDLTPEPGATEVSVDFAGRAEPNVDAGWRVTLVAADASGVCRYSPMVRGGKVSLALRPTDRTVTLAVAACPTEYIPQPFRPGYHQKPRFPYEVSFAGARPAAAPPLPTPAIVPGAPHPNGGGFVAATATVAASAFVAPGARVEGTATVGGDARIEDFAVVSGSARVGGNAIVGGWARVRGKAVVDGDARVRECARVDGEVRLTGNARVREYAYLQGKGEVRGDVFVRGFGEINLAPNTALDGGLIAGEDLEVHLAGYPKPVLDGGLLYGFLDRGLLEKEVVDNGGRFVHWDCDSPSPTTLRDTFADADGVLRGGAAFGIEAGRFTLRLDGKGQYALVEGHIADSRELTFDVKFRADATAPAPLLDFRGPGGAALTLSTAGVTITARGRTESLTLPSPLPAGRFVRLTAAIGERDWVLYVDGREAARKATTLHPEDVRAEWGYLGRGFAGALDDIWVLRKALAPSESKP